jgi:quercetin dioxygenase-like cupin family protein
VSDSVLSCDGTFSSSHFHRPRGYRASEFCSRAESAVARVNAYRRGATDIAIGMRSLLEVMMKHHQVVGVLLLCSGIVVGIGLGRLWAQEKIMPQGKSPIVATADLAADIGIPARVSVSHVTIAEGYRMTTHKHEGRTAIVTVLKGVVREHRGDVYKDYKAGDVFVVTNQTTHHNAAGGNGPAEYVEVNIIKTAP